jgi:twitching motility protein PilT
MHSTMNQTRLHDTAPSENAMATIGRIFEHALLAQASDIHIGADERIAIRVNGDIRFLDEYGTLSEQDAEALIFSLFPSEDKRTAFIEKKEADFSFKLEDGSSFRCNLFFKRGRIAASLRLIGKNHPTLADIGVPEKVFELLRHGQGLILVSGPTGQGKTTTLSGMIQELNTTRQGHILTLEDPIEYVFESDRCLVSQRELSSDTHSFDHSLRAAMRQDPDIVVVGEMRDAETVNAVFNLVATGHLVISTVHAGSASHTLYRILRMFPEKEREIVLHQLADSLLGVLNQELVPSADGSRVALFELLVANWATRNAIRNGNISEIENAIATSLNDGMVTKEQSVKKLLENGLVRLDAVRDLLTSNPIILFQTETA